ncbi:MAG: cytochrome b/b6 domain-containing protein [Desulfuromonadaceae bacterium]|nr:cytochrome b/b6 domain-containing protein [Desulfuromonadaceae bacterium]
MTDSTSSDSTGRLYYRHSLPVRIMHWLMVLLLPTLLMSGLNIFNANPELFWGKSSYTGTPPLLEIKSAESDSGGTVGVTKFFGREFTTTGILGASNGRNGELEERGFPSWLTIPGNRWLSMARRWHLFFAWLLVINSVCLVSYSVFSRHLRRDLLPTRRDWYSIGKTLRDHLLLRHPTGEAAKNYNILQKLAYIGVIFILIPLIILNGFGMSPGIDALFPGWVDVFGGRQSTRTIHFVVAWILVAFTAIHLFQVVVTGFWNNIRSMITGSYRIKSEAGHE